MLRDKLKLDLQLFADQGEGKVGEGKEADTHDGDDTKHEGKEGKEGKEEKTFTQEELDGIIKDRLARERANHEKEIRAKVEKERKEAKRLADLSADEREKEVLKQKESDLADREHRLNMKELEIDTIDRLSEEGLPIKFKGFVMQDDADTTNENVKLFKEEWVKAIDAAVDERLKGTTPGQGGTSRKTKANRNDLQKIMEDARIIGQ